MQNPELKMIHEPQLKNITNNTLNPLVEIALRQQIHEPILYTAQNVTKQGLPVRLAGSEFTLPVLQEGNVRFAWLNPDGSDKELQEACAVELAIRLAKQTDGKRGVVILPPSSKSTEMAEIAVRIASGLNGNDFLLVKAGGGLSENATEKLSPGKIQPMEIILTPNQKLISAIRYMPVTGKDKIMFLPEDVFLQIQEVLDDGGVLSMLEDVVTLGTTVEAMERLLGQAGIRHPLQIMAVAKEGNDYAKPMSYAIHLPLL